MASCPGPLRGIGKLQGEEEVTEAPEEDENVKKRKRKRKHKSRKKSAPDGDGEDPPEEEEDPESIPSSLKQSGMALKTIYVEGISYDASEDDLKSFFQSKGSGGVTSVRMPRYHDSNKPRGYAHVDFDKPEGVIRALKLDGEQMMGRYLSIQQAKEPGAAAAAAAVKSKPPGCRTVFVKNLPYDISEEDVKTTFAVCGKIANIRLAIWNHTKALKGFGYVDFVNETSAEIALKKQGQLKVKGRVVHMDYETGQPKLSFRTTDGKSWNKLNKTKRSR